MATAAIGTVGWLVTNQISPTSEFRFDWRDYSRQRKCACIEFVMCFFMVNPGVFFLSFLLQMWKKRST